MQKNPNITQIGGSTKELFNRLSNLDLKFPPDNSSQLTGVKVR